MHGLDTSASLLPALWSYKKRPLERHLRCRSSKALAYQLLQINYAHQNAEMANHAKKKKHPLGLNFSNFSVYLSCYCIV